MSYRLHAVMVLCLLLIGSCTSSATEPLVDYDWSTFSENKRLSEDFTRAVKEVFEPGYTESNPHWLGMKREMFAEIEYLGFQEMTINLLRGFKSNRYVGFTVKRTNGTVVESWTTASERYRFPMVVQFQPGGGLVIKTNGLEKRFDYAQSKDDLKLQFTWLLYSALSDQFRKTPKYREQEAQKARAAQEAEKQRLEKAKQSWE